MKIILISLGSEDYPATQSDIDNLRNDIETSIKKNEDCVILCHHQVKTEIIEINLKSK